MRPKKSFEVHAEIVVKLTEEDVTDIICTALEGGIGYWCCLDNTSDAYENAPYDEPVSITAAKIMLGGGSLDLIDEEDGGTHRLDIEALMRGFRVWIEKGYDRWNVVCGQSVDLCNLDGPGADGIIQCALFGDLVYG